MGFYESDPERAAAKQEGVALIQQGISYRVAAQAVGLPTSTLQAAVAKLKEGAATDEDLKRADQAAMSQTYAIAEQAQQRVLEHLEGRTLDARDTIQAMAQSLKALSMYRRWQKPEGEAQDLTASTRILDRLERAIQGGAELTLTVAGPRQDSSEPEASTVVSVKPVSPR